MEQTPQLDPRSNETCRLQNNKKEGQACKLLDTDDNEPIRLNDQQPVTASEEIVELTRQQTVVQNVALKIEEEIPSNLVLVDETKLTKTKSAAEPNKRITPEKVESVAIERQNSEKFVIYSRANTELKSTQY